MLMILLSTLVGKVRKRLVNIYNQEGCQILQGWCALNKFSVSTNETKHMTLSIRNDTVNGRIMLYNIN